MPQDSESNCGHVDEEEPDTAFHIPSPLLEQPLPATQSQDHGSQDHNTLDNDIAERNGDSSEGGSDVAMANGVTGVDDERGGSASSMDTNDSDSSGELYKPCESESDANPDTPASKAGTPHHAGSPCPSAGHGSAVTVGDRTGVTGQREGVTLTPPGSYESDENCESNRVEAETDKNVIRRKRRYRYVKRHRRSSGVSKMRKRWSQDLQGIKDDEVKATKCCTRRKCFKNVNVSFLRAKMASMLTMSAENRRKNLGSMLGSSGSYHFDGAVVCSSFLIQAFRFSRDLQCSVRVKMELGEAETNSQESDEDEVVRRDVESKGKDAVITFLERLAENTGEKCRIAENSTCPSSERAMCTNNS